MGHALPTPRDSERGEAALGAHQQHRRPAKPKCTSKRTEVPQGRFRPQRPGQTKGCPPGSLRGAQGGDLPSLTPGV